MNSRLGRWLNSIEAHMIFLALGTIAAITGFSVIAINLSDIPSSGPVSVYEMTRIVRGLDLVQSPRKLVRQGVVADPPLPEGEAEQRLSALLASRLGMRPGDVRVQLKSDRLRADAIVDEMKLYGDEGSANPVAFGGFTIFVRQPDGAWKTFDRVVDHWQARSLRFWRYAAYYMGIILVLPLAMLISSRIGRPVRTFATAADRIGAGLDDTPVPVAGPTEIRLAAIALNEMQARISRFVRERTVLVGAIAHDLRTPLSNMRFRIANADPATRTLVEEEILRMERLISSTLDYVEGEGRPFASEPLDLGSLLQTLVDEGRDRGAAVSLAGRGRITITGDLVRLTRLFSNLIENGLKFGRHVVVAYRQDGDEVVVDVIDDGPGMAEDDMERAFDPFFRAERSRNSSTGGIGLGLAIALSAASAHGGSIVLGNLDAGFRARVRLPANATGQAELAGGADPAAREGERTV